MLAPAPTRLLTRRPTDASLPTLSRLPRRLTPAPRQPHLPPPVIPDGRKISTSAITAPIVTQPRPGRQRQLEADVHALLSIGQKGVQAADQERPSTAPDRLDTPPTTSIASVVKVSSTDTWLVVIEPSSCTSRPPAKPASAPLITNA